MNVEILVLSQLMNGPKHGYVIKKNINSLISNTSSINNNTLYPMFRKFVKDGIAIKEVTYQESKPNKFVYSITEKGKHHFYNTLRRMPENKSHDLEEFLVRVSLFEYIDNEDKQKILNVREHYLRGALEYFYREKTEQENNDYIPRKEDFADCETMKLKIELDMIENLRKKYAHHANCDPVNLL